MKAKLPSSPSVISEDDVWTALRGVLDPEVPVIDVVALGIIRGVQVNESEILVTLTPTYSGCPAINVIQSEVRNAVTKLGRPCRIETVFSPPWTTDWISEPGRSALIAYGIAPPGPREQGDLVQISRSTATSIACPLCGSLKTKETSRFGATACKALYYCDGCLQPFEYMKAF